MTGNLALDWALAALSFFNMFIMLWLGLTVLLNAERRSWGVWLMGGGLLMGAAFFVSHTAILGSELRVTRNSGLNFWWQIGWIPVILSPLAWYIVILWYAGFWNDPPTRLRRRHRFWLVVALDMAFGLAFLLIFAHPIPSYSEIIRLNLSTTFTVNGIPILFTLYPIFMILCLALSLDALRRPEPAERLMGDLARQRSRPWLLAASAGLLAVSLLVGYFIFRVFSTARSAVFLEFSLTSVALFDLALQALVAVATVLLGQAVIAYEVFTGKVLPRRGFFRQWRSAVILAAGYSLLVGGSFVIQLRSIYTLLLATLLMVAFYALYNWRAFQEREQFVARLRPFVSSQRLLHQLLSDESSFSSARLLFEAVCRDVLEAQQAQLIPAGGLSPLAGPPLLYPDAVAEPIPYPLDDLAENANITPLDPALYNGLQWAIPLWAERGRVGALLLGEKQSGGLYTQEEVEIARASGERIIDLLAGEQMARRLMALQRGRLTESRVMDRRTRRALHDETLPTLHTALLRLSSLPRDEPAVRDAIQALTTAHGQVADLIHTVNGLPLPPKLTGDLAALLRPMIEAEFSDEFNAMTWQVDEDLPLLEPLAQEVVIGAVREAVRNAAVHGRGNQPDRPLSLSIAIERRDGLTVTIQDDGVGMGDVGANRRFAPVTPDVPSGSGGGLVLHSTMLAIIGGSLTVELAPERGTRVIITLPVEQQSDRK